MAEHCQIDQTGEDIPGPRCQPLLEAFASVISDRRMCPTHICMETAWNSTDRWLEQSGICRHLGAPAQLREQLGMLWPYWPLEIGRAALDTYAGVLPAFDAIRAGLPFDGDQHAIVAFRITRAGQTLDFFGLGESRTIPAPHDADAVIPQLVAGSSVAVLRGDRLWESNPTPEVLRALGLAQKWWEKLRGQKVGSGGNPGHFDGPDDPRIVGVLHSAAHSAVKAGGKVNYASLGDNGFGDWRTAKKYVWRYDLDAIYREAASCTSGVSICRFDVRHQGEFLKKQG